MPVVTEARSPACGAPAGAIRQDRGRARSPAESEFARVVLIGRSMNWMTALGRRITDLM